MGCQDSAEVTITEPTALIATGSATPITCFGDADGSVSVAASEGTPGYTYAWSTVPSETTSDVSGLIPGSYSVTITDANGCTETVSTTVGDQLEVIAGICFQSTISGGIANG